jgi:RimJ/RimL family protein N-acetyltransferase
MGEEFRLRRVLVSEVDEVFETHRQNITPFIWPRDEGFFRDRIERGELFLIRNAEDRCVGTSYVLTEDCEPTAPKPREFGGLFLDEAVRGRALAGWMGVVALATTYTLDVDTNRFPPVIAHVHMENRAPHKVLARLGFEPTSTVQLPGDAPANMKRDDEGFVRGDELHFLPLRLHQLADKLERFDGHVGDGDRLVIDVYAFQTPWLEGLVASLRDLASTIAGRCPR